MDQAGLVFSSQSNCVERTGLVGVDSFIALGPSDVDMSRRVDDRIEATGEFIECIPLGDIGVECFDI